MNKTLLEDDEPLPYEIVNGSGRAPLVIVCDHASNTIPRRLEQLGLPDQRLHEHIAIDLGGEALSRSLANILDAPLVLARFSRLVVDLNRPLQELTLIPEVSDGILIPGNQNLSEDHRRQRIEEIFIPYHQAVSREIDRVTHACGRVGVIAVHSFTPSMGGTSRPWHIGILWTEDQRISRPLIESLCTEPDLCVGDNQPYDARKHVGYTVEHHGGERGLPHVLIEVRQDLIESPQDPKPWAVRLAQHLQPILIDLGLG